MYVHVCVAGLTHAFALLGQNHPPGSCGQSPHFMIHCRNALILLISVVFTTYNPIHPPGLPIVYSEANHSSTTAVQGPIPTSFFSDLPSLKSLVLSGNWISGPLPISIGFASSLTNLDLAWNAMVSE